MNKREILALRDSVKSEYKAKIKKLEEELNEKLKAIDIVAKIASVDYPNILNRKLTAITRNRRSTISEMVREAIMELDDIFSLHDIRNHIIRKNPNIEISRNVSHSVLSQLKASGQIEMVEEGKGTIPAKYKKTEHYQGGNSENK